MTGPEQNVPRPQALPALTGARFFAAAGVVGYHYQSILHCPAWLDPLVGSGRSGVCFFYILSGFILTYNYKTWFAADTRRWKPFAEARLARVYPMYFVSMLLALAVVIGWDLPRYRSLLEESSYTHLTPLNMVGSFLADTFCLQPFMPSPEVELLWNPANWSIPCELFFYLCFPAFLVWLNKRRMTRRGLIATAATIYAAQSLVFVVIAAAIARYWTPTSILGRFTVTRYLATDLFVYRSPILRFGEFAVGVIVCLLFMDEREKGPVSMSQPWRRTAGILLCLAGIVVVASVDVPPAWFHAITWLRAFTLFTPLYAMLIMLLARGGTPFARLLSWRPIELLGESSYSLYLIHTFILTIPLYKLRSGHALSGIEIAIYLAITLIVSVICFKWIETPARKKWRALVLKSTRSSARDEQQIA